jgi:uncharacterized protein (DUF362 family)
MNPGDGRRGALRGIAATALGVSPLGRLAEALALPGPQPAPRSAPSRAVVAVSRRDGMTLPNAGLDPEKLRQALGAVVARAAGEATPLDACRRLFRPNDVVGIKVNCIAGRGLSSRPEVAHQLASFLQASGLPAERIVIWDRSERELRDAGFTPNGGRGVRVVGIDADYDGAVREWGPSGSRFARLLIEDITALIDLPVLKDHGLAGVSLGLKNWYGAVHNPNKLHADNCQPFVPHLAAFPLIREKLRLTVVDGTIGQCHGGPGRSPRWAWPYQGFLASSDVVAVDAVGLRVLEARRKEVGLPAFSAEGREPTYIAAAAKLGLGVADPGRIELVET